MKPSPAHWPQIYLCVALTTLGTLLLELSLTRIFSVVFYYHFAFLAISIALFGLGLGGVFSYVVATWKSPLYLKLGRLSAINSFLVVLALVTVVAQPNELTDWNLALVYFTTALPFFLSGAIVSLVISETIQRVGKVYFCDLLGAAGGCLLLIVLLDTLGGTGTVLAASVLFAAAGAIWYSMAGSVRGRVACVSLSLAMVGFVTLNHYYRLVDIRHAKGQNISANEIFRKWNSFSRIALLDDKSAGNYMIVIDADASTAIATDARRRPFDFDHLTPRDRHDLLGAATGCLLLILLLDTLGGPSTVLAAGVLYAVAGAIWCSMAGSVRGRIACVVLSLAMVGFVTLNHYFPMVDIRHAKGQTIGAHDIFRKWNSFSRIALVDNAREGNYMIVIDADASTAIATDARRRPFDFVHLTARDRHDLLEQGPALPYAVRPGAKALIIGPGGGWDVARALASGSHDITAVEINPIIARTIMQQRYAALSGDLYGRPDVHLYIEDGRSFVRRSSDRYQVLQATLVDTWASTAAGAFALSENNLYTVDAMRDYLQHLTPDGLVAFTRWGFDPPRESLRLISLAIEALSQVGETDPASHVIVGREGSVEGWGARDTVLISRSPFKPADIDRARALFIAAGMQAVYLPGVYTHNQFYDLLHTPIPTATSATTSSTSRRSPITARSSSTRCSRATSGTFSPPLPTAPPITK